MSVIVIPTTYNHRLHHAQFHNKTSAVPAALSVGEILETRVIEKLSDRNILIALKGIKMPAEAEVALNKGDAVRVRVESLHPQVILRIMGGVFTEESQVVDYLRWQRANPDALSQMVTEAFSLLNGENLGKILRYLPEEVLQRTSQMFKLLVLSQETIGGNFVKDYLGNLGMLMESHLRKIMEGGQGVNKGDVTPQNLKSLLVRLSDEIQNLLMKREALDNEGIITLTKLSEFVDSSLKTIESQQIMNFILQEAESKYLFQIPILFPDSVRKGDIFIEYDRNKRNKGHEGHHRVIVFLNMDILGEMIIEATLEGTILGCLIKCKDQETCDFVSSFLEELRRALVAAGCEISAMTCVAGGDLTGEKIEYYQDRIVYAREVVDIFV
jgi:hypothetical protein